MKFIALAFALASACLAAGAAQAHADSIGAQAQIDYSVRYNYGDDWRGEHHPDREPRAERRGRHHVRGAGPDRNMYVGDRLPRHYWEPSHWVGNTRRMHLPRAPYGHGWVRTGNGDCMLVHVDSGRIVRVILRNR